MSAQANIETQKKFGEAVNTGHLDLLRDLISSDSIDHDPSPGQGTGPEGYIKFFKMMRTAFPDLKVEVEQLVADEDKVAFAYTITGTHEGVFMEEVQPTGKKIKARGMQISKFENGKMTERWGSSDELGILKQLGVKLEEI
ncbi:ester cyclase [uncultured Mucilaginibacter sp.]|uniref:ester cyclase n=1 Tax=uncultured Mucilaginibacter sp. TaxID=797541 RepID=UPI002625C8B5|nr:ester cyclase [uncultured Mucilaginibacter sp.]